MYKYMYKMCLHLCLNIPIIRILYQESNVVSSTQTSDFFPKSKHPFNFKTHKKYLHIDLITLLYRPHEYIITDYHATIVGNSSFGAD